MSDVWKRKTLSRRVSLIAVAMISASIGLSACGTGSPSTAGTPSASQGPPKLASLRGKTLVVGSWGGAWTHDEQQYLYGPFSKLTGVKVQYIINGSDPGVDALLEEKAHHVTMDIVNPLVTPELSSKGYLVNFPEWLLRTFHKWLRPGTFSKNTFSFGQSAYVIACNPAVVRRCPSTPSEFFNVKAYPGARAMEDQSSMAIPFALAATGVSTAKLYSDWDIPRAIAELRKIKSAVSVWPSSGNQQVSVMTDKQVGISVMNNGQALLLEKDIPHLKISWAGSTVILPSGYNVLKGAPDVEGALAFLNWLSQHPKNQAEWTRAIEYPMPGRSLKHLLGAKLWAALPIGSKAAPVSAEYLYKENATLETVWQTFLTG